MPPQKNGVADMPHKIETAFTQALRHLWGNRRTAGLAVQTGRSAPTCRTWINGTRTVPVDVLDELVSFLRRHSAVSLALADSLEREADKARVRRRKPTGFMIIRDRDGTGIPRDGRNRRGRPRHHT